MATALNRPLLDIARVAGIALLLAFLTMSAGGILWSTAAGSTGGGSSRGTARHVWERGLLMAAIVLTAVGLLLLARHLRGTGGVSVVLVGAAVYAAAGVLGLVHEAGNVSSGFEAASWVLPVYVVGAFIGQATVGLGLAQESASSAAIGWVVLAWNLGWLVILPIFSPADLYFPVLHHLVLPGIAIPLLFHG